MLIARLQEKLTTPTHLKPRRFAYRVWLGLSLALPVIYGLLALQQALSGPYVVQDDARQFLFWMQRWLDPTLFPNDLIADYFQSVTPLGFKALYGGAIAFGIPPFTFNLALPLLLGLVSTQYLFRLTLAILPIPFTAWVACVLLNQTLWMKDDLVSGTPRAFVYPLFLAFLFYWTQFQMQLDKRQSQGQERRQQGGQGLWQFTQPSCDRSMVACALSLGLLGLFYPQYLLLAGMMLVIAALSERSARRLSFRFLFRGIFSGRLLGPRLKADSESDWRSRWTLRFYATTLTVAATLVGFYAVKTSTYGPAVTVEQARTMAEFWPGGRNFFFSENLWWFYGVGNRSGFLHVGLVRPATLCLGLFLPLILRFRSRFPLATAITPQIHRLIQLLAAASVLFLTAHVLLFRLHLPSRYSDHSLRIVLAIASAITITLLLDSIFNACRHRHAQIRHAPIRHAQTRFSLPPSFFPLMALGFILTLLIFYPLWVKPFPLTKYKIGKTPEIYAYLRQQPVNAVVASIEKEVDNIPIFAQRSLLVGHEYAIPYHTGYYGQFRQRAIALIQAQYTSQPEELTRFIQHYRIHFWLLGQNAYEPDYFKKHWARQYLSKVDFPGGDGPGGDFPGDWSEASRLVPVLQQMRSQCSVIQEQNLALVDAQCIVRTLEADGSLETDRREQSQVNLLKQPLDSPP